MRKECNEDNYAEFLFTFTNIFFRDIVLEARLKLEHISDILTPSDEAFLLLCIKIYFNAFTDLQIEGFDPLFTYVSKVGWTAEAIDLYNILYHRVVANRITWDQQFGITFQDHVAKTIDKRPKKRRRTAEKLIPVACNDL